MTETADSTKTKKKRRSRAFPKGRQVDPAALAEIRGLLGTQPRQRDLLIEFLHLIQDAFGHISAAHVAALADEMKLAQTEVFEVATFYHHFDVVREGETPPPALTVRVCSSLTCAMHGAGDLQARLAETLGTDVRVVPAPCVGACDRAPVAVVGRRQVGGATVEAVSTVVAEGDTEQPAPDHETLESYRRDGGFASLEDLRAGRLTVESVMETLEAAGLRGLGGAGFPSFRKWQFVRAEAGPRYLCVNADEGEPGTFKDRWWLERHPFRFLEGMLIAAHGVDAAGIYIYLRDEYPAVHLLLVSAIRELEDAGLVPAEHIHVRRGAGAYICGEESAMIESIEGKRGLPRHRPPYVAQVGLFDRPTLVHNVETLAWMPEILRRGADWFADQGKTGHKGPRSWSVSGRVKSPGVKIAPAGVTVRELIEDHCDGMADGHEFRAYLPGGASGGILPASLGDLPLDFGSLDEQGCFVGSHAVVILSDKDDMAFAARNLLEFFAEESCGQCTPCRVGCEKAVTLMGKKRWDTALLDELATTMADASICGLGQAAPNPIRSVMRHFGEDIR